MAPQDQDDDRKTASVKPDNNAQPSSLFARPRKKIITIDERRAMAITKIHPSLSRTSKLYEQVVSNINIGVRGGYRSWSALWVWKKFEEQYIMGAEEGERPPLDAVLALMAIREVYGHAKNDAYDRMISQHADWIEKALKDDESEDGDGGDEQGQNVFDSEAQNQVLPSTENADGFAPTPEAPSPSPPPPPVAAPAETENAAVLPAPEPAPGEPVTSQTLLAELTAIRTDIANMRADFNRRLASLPLTIGGHAAVRDVPMPGNFRLRPESQLANQIKFRPGGQFRF